MSKKTTTPKELSRETQRYIMGRKYMIYKVNQEMKAFKFKDFDGSYQEYLKERRKFEYKINEYEDDIKVAILADGDEPLIVGNIC